MPDSELFAQFEEFLNQKAEAEKNAASSEDFDVEIWDESGRGVRTKRSHAKPFLQQLGIDLDPEPESESTDKETDKGKGKPVGRQTQNSTSTNVARKYFTPTKK